MVGQSGNKPARALSMPQLEVIQQGYEQVVQASDGIKSVVSRKKVDKWLRAKKLKEEKILQAAEIEKNKVEEFGTVIVPLKLGSSKPKLKKKKKVENGNEVPDAVKEAVNAEKLASAVSTLFSVPKENLDVKPAPTSLSSHEKGSKSTAAKSKGKNKSDFSLPVIS